MKGRKLSNQQDKLDRISRLQGSIAQLESYLSFFESQGKQAPLSCWVARYQVKQRDKVYWYYKLQASVPLFAQKHNKSFSKYQHLGKSGSISHVEAVMAVTRRTIVTELQKSIDSLKGALLDIAFDGEQESL